MRIPVLGLVGLLLAGAGQAQGAPPRNADAVVAAERAFAARALQVGVARSFVDFMTDDALMFAPGPVNAKALYGARLPGKSPAEGGVQLVWWPAFAGIARSGDLGFTTGPAEVNGKRSVHYFTVWKRQPSGEWRWVYDGGVASNPAAAAGPDHPVRHLPVSMATSLAPTEAFRQVQAAEATLAAQARGDLAAAYASVLAPEARLQGTRLAPAETPAAWQAELKERGDSFVFTTKGGQASEAGDLAWTWGDAAWTRAGEACSGHYVRVWQRRPAGWRLVMEQLHETRRD
jgi:ketosteroid isomerase-like protein